MLALSSDALNVLIAGAVAFAGLFVFIVKVALEVGGMKTKMDLVWGVFLRNALIEGNTHGVSTGVFTKNTPLACTDKARRAFGGELATTLRRFWSDHAGSISDDAELALEIERNFGQRIARDVCPVLGIQQPTALLIAIEIAKGKPSDLADLDSPRGREAHG